MSQQSLLLHSGNEGISCPTWFWLSMAKITLFSPEKILILPVKSWFGRLFFFSERWPHWGPVPPRILFFPASARLKISFNVVSFPKLKPDLEGTGILGVGASPLRGLLFIFIYLDGWCYQGHKVLQWQSQSQVSLPPRGIFGVFVPFLCCGYFLISQILLHHLRAPQPPWTLPITSETLWGVPSSPQRPHNPLLLL